MFSAIKEILVKPLNINSWIILSILFFICSLLGSHFWIFSFFEYFRFHFSIFIFLLICVIIYTFFDKGVNRRTFYLFLVLCLVFILNLSFFSYYKIRNSSNISQNSFSILNVNLNSQNRYYDHVIKRLSQIKPDMIFLNEISYSHVPMLDSLREEFPFQFRHPQENNFGFALISKVQFVKPEIIAPKNLPPLPLLKTSFSVNGEEIIFYGVHMVPPMSPEYKRIRDSQFSYLASLLVGEDKPVLIVGDYNDIPSSLNFREFLKRSNSHVVGYGASWPDYIDVLGLPIDLFIAKNMRNYIFRSNVERRLGSDHAGVLLQFKKDSDVYSISKSNKLPCYNDISESCVREYLSTYMIEGANMWSLAENLAKSGLYDSSLKAVEIGVKTDLAKGLNDIPLRLIVASQILEQSKNNPNQIANLDLIKELNDNDTELGHFVTYKKGMEKNSYSTLSFLMLGHIGGFGARNAVEFHEYAANKRFKPNATWYEFLRRWENLANDSPEPDKSAIYLRIAETLSYAGYDDHAKQYLKKVSKQEKSIIRAYKLAIKLKLFDDAIEFSKDKHFSAYITSVLAKAEHLYNKKDIRNTLDILDNLFDAIKNSKHPSGKLDGLLEIARLYNAAGQGDKALIVAKWTEDYIKSDKVRNTLSFHRIPAVYRLAGSSEKARSLMLTKENYKKDSCGPISDEMKGFLAIEFIQQDQIKKALQVLGYICDEERKLDSWLQMYDENYSMKGEELDVLAFVSTLQPHLHTNLYNSLASFYYLKNKKEEGDTYLVKAFDSAFSAVGTKPLCDAVITAHYASRYDLLSNSFKIGYSGLLNIGKLHSQKEKTQSLENLLLSPSRKPIDYNFEVYSNLTKLLSCHHQIEIHKE